MEFAAFVFTVEVANEEVINNLDDWLEIFHNHYKNKLSIYKRRKNNK